MELIIFALIAGIVLFISGFKQLRLKRLIENIPTSKIRSLAIGLVEIYGTVIAKNEPLKIPITKRNCVYYYFEIEKRTGDNWHKIYSEESKEQFYVKDDTGTVLINPQSAKLDVDKRFVSEFNKNLPENLKEFLESKQLKYKNILGKNKDIRYTEISIAPKDRIYVMGTATTNSEANSTSKGHEQLIIKKGHKNEIFTISYKTENMLLKTFKMEILLKIYGGATLIIIGTIFAILALIKI